MPAFRWLRPSFSPPFPLAWTHTPLRWLPIQPTALDSATMEAVLLIRELALLITSTKLLLRETADRASCAVRAAGALPPPAETPVSICAGDGRRLGAFGADQYLVSNQVHARLMEWMGRLNVSCTVC